MLDCFDSLALVAAVDVVINILLHALPVVLGANHLERLRLSWMSGGHVVVTRVKDLVLEVRVVGYYHSLVVMEEPFHYRVDGGSSVIRDEADLFLDLLVSLLGLY